MCRNRRYIESGKMYELSFRAKDTLPLVANMIIRIIIKHAIARAQRDEKVYLCHDIWNGSHSHIIVLTKDGEQCKKFYMEVKKKITDCIKMLFRLDELSIWESRPGMVAKIGDKNKAIKRIVYLYSNPAKDDLVDSIEKFPGYSSYNEFLEAKDKGVIAETSENVIRLRLNSIPKLKTRAPSKKQTQRVVLAMYEDNKERQALVRHPNMWMRAFNIQDDEVSEINQEIMRRLRKREAAAKYLRKRKGKKPMGAAQLEKQAILAPHTPKKTKKLNIVYMGSYKRDRIAFYNKYKAFCEQCKQCYEDTMAGKRVTWPPAAFIPHFPPIANVIR